VAHPFRAYEVALLEHLLADEFSRERLSEVLNNSSDTHVEYNGYGFYVSVRHPAIGISRRVYSAPPSSAGHSEGRMAGFIAFLENSQLTLEIYPWDGDCLPGTFRDGEVRIGP
jgi:hypothetical protein